ncbi:MAG TPA: succinate dehydrogenase assembly factor 2 [Rhodanobacteraceae bacterium]|jgi:antitoxin CptB|nr:succinate dehydrogenase assembly factor 2 [Rhodanobacteraceae bacterium]
MEADPPASTGAPALIKRLQWRCRRGTRELDALLGGWLDRHAGDTDVTALQAFDTLLDQQDPDLWNWLMGHAPAPRVDWQAIVDEIREHAGLDP